MNIGFPYVRAENFYFFNLSDRLSLGLFEQFDCTAWQKIPPRLILAATIIGDMSLVEDYMNSRMVTRASKSSVLEVSKAMSDSRISSVAITDEQNKQIVVVGILTERDIVHSIAKGVHPEKTIASSLMSTPVFCITNNQPIEDAARLMVKNKVRHLIVEDAYHGAIGMITTTDLARYLKQKVQEQQTAKGQQQQQQPESSDLLSEVWELYF
jgi:CBS domain-containing protein